jgi:hypothetical protein
MRTRLALSLVVGLLAGALSPPAAAGAQSYTYPPECSAYRLGLASTSDSTRFACAVQRARVDRLNAGALVTRYDSIAASYRFRYGQAAKAETTAATAFANYLATRAPKPPPVIVAASILVRPERVPDVVVGSAPVQLTGTVRDATGATLVLPVTWSVAPASVATITSTGLLVPIGPGVATVTASTPTAPSVARTLVVTVTAAQPPPVVVTTPPPVDTAAERAAADARRAAGHDLDAPVRAAPERRRVRRVPARYGAARRAGADADDSRRLAPGGIRHGAHGRFADLIPANHTTQDFAAGPTARASWVTIQGTDSTSRINTAIGGATSAVAVLSRAHHVRFLGPLWITSTTSNANAIFRSYNGETSVADVPRYIILDGVTIDAGAANEARRCAWPDGAYIAIVRSRLLNCATKGGDAQGIFVANGPGPYRFEGNYIEGSHQCFMSGGGDPSIPGSIPSDVVFRYNVCEKPARWHYAGTVPNQTYPGTARQVKTIFESKNLRRALVEGNYFHVVYVDAQAGFCILLKSSNQDGTAPWSQTLDVTVRYNRCANIASGINLAAHPQGGVPMTRVSVYDNTFDTLSTVGGEGIGAQILDDVVDVILLHNSFSNTSNNAVGFDGAAGVRTVLAANVLPHGDYGVKGSGSSDGTPTIARWMPGGIFASNVITGAPDCSVYPLSTVCTPTAALPSVMPLGYDGRPAGANLAAVNAAIARALAGTVGP